MEGKELLRRLENQLTERYGIGPDDGIGGPEWDGFPNCWREYGLDRDGCVRNPDSELMQDIINLYYEFFKAVTTAIEERLNVKPYWLQIVVEPSYEDSSTVIVLHDRKVLLNWNGKAWNFGADSADGLAEELFSFFDIIAENIENVPEEWEEIGKAAVDSGSLMITDPCYLEQKEVHNAGDKLMEEYNKGHWPPHRQLNFDKGHAGAGVVFSSGCGDGFYPVYAKVEGVPGWGERITEVLIVMEQQPYLEEKTDGVQSEASEG